MRVCHSYLLAICLVLVSATGSLAQDRCALPTALHALLLSVGAAQHDAAVLQSRFDRVSRLPRTTLNRFRRDPTTAKLLESVFDGTRRSILDGRAPTQETKADAQAFWQAWDKQCQTQSKAVFGPVDDDAIRQSVGPVPLADSLAARVSIIVGFQRMSAIMAGIIAFAISALVLEYGVKRVLVFWFDRRSCLISAHLKVGDAKIEGAVNIMSRTTYQFKPADEIELNKAVRVEPSRRADLIVEHINLRSTVLSVDLNAARLVFNEPLTAHVHRELLARSTLTTHYLGPEKSSDTVPKTYIDTELAGNAAAPNT